LTFLQLTVRAEGGRVAELKNIDEIVSLTGTCDEKIDDSRGRLMCVSGGKNYRSSLDGRKAVQSLFEPQSCSQLDLLAGKSA
jgi:hypothetical protein